MLKFDRRKDEGSKDDEDFLVTASQGEPLVMLCNPFGVYTFSSASHSHAYIDVQSGDTMMIRNDNETGWFERV